MKRFKLLFSLFVISSLVLTSCKKDKGSDPSSTKIEGNYKIESVFVTDNGVREDVFPGIVSFLPCMKDFLFKLNAGNIAIEVPEGCDFAGDFFGVDSVEAENVKSTYTLDGNNITYKLGDDVYQGEIVSDNQIVMVVPDDSGVEQEVILKKQ